VPTRTNNLQSLIPHMPVPPRKCAPSLLNIPSTTPLPFWGFNNRLERKSQSTVAVVGNLQEINSQQFSHLERVSHGPDNLPLQYPTGPDKPCFFETCFLYIPSNPLLLSKLSRHKNGDGNNTSSGKVQVHC
jgi:hypothetical protein